MSQPPEHTTLPHFDMEGTTELGQSVIQGLKEAVLYKRGFITEADGITVHRFTEEADEINVQHTRKKLALTQQEFARFINTSERSVQHWEQKTRRPEGPTRMLLELISRNPKMVWETMQNSH